MPLAEARALVRTSESLVVRRHNPEAVQKALETLAIWCDQFSPVVHVEGMDTLLIDMTGTQRLFTDENALLKTIGKQLHRLGYTSRLACADTCGAAWALAHVHDDDRAIAQPGATAASLARLPVWALRLDEACVQSLRSLGVATIEALLHMPRSSLALRFGDALVLRIDQALGDVPELLVPFRPPSVVGSSISIAASTDRLDILKEAIARVTDTFCKKLENRVAGVQQIFLRFGRPTLRPFTIEQTMSRPTRSVGHLQSLLLSTLDRLTTIGIHGRIDKVGLWARHLIPLDALQAELFEPDVSRYESIGQLIDRLSNQLGTDNVVRTRPQSDHLPERVYSHVPALSFQPNVKHKVAHDASMEHRPICLLARPVRVSMISVIPDGPPAQFSWSGTQFEIVRCIGPERIETGWWRGRHVQRDYYRAACHTGQHAWLFRERMTGEWFLHGWFD